MRKPFAGIQTDAEYLRAVGMGPEEALNGWVARIEDAIAFKTQQIKSADLESICQYHGPSLAIHDTDPARKWENIANALLVLGPEMDRRGITEYILNDSVLCADLPHTALLEAFYNAHAQGDNA